MSNLRIIYNNAIDRATLTASSTAGTLVASNMKLDKKSKVWRSAGTSESITSIWTTSEIINGVILPHCNLTSTATMRVRAYTLSGDGSPIFDSGANLAAPYVGLGLWDWGAIPLGVNAYSYGGGTYAVCWFDNSYSIQKIVIDIEDPDNTATYIECARIVSGSAWSPTYNTSFGIPVSYVDTGTQTRSGGGDMITNRGITYKQINLDLAYMNASDRQRFNEIMRGNGLPRPVFLSVFPEDPDPEKEQTYQVYGKMPEISQLTHPMHTIYSGAITIQEI